MYILFLRLFNLNELLSLLNNNIWNTMHQNTVTLVPYIPILERAHMPTNITNTAFVATTTMYTTA